MAVGLGELDHVTCLELCLVRGRCSVSSRYQRSSLHFILITTLWSRCSEYVHFMDENTEAQRGTRTCPKSHSW